MLDGETLAARRAASEPDYNAPFAGWDSLYLSGGRLTTGPRDMWDYASSMLATVDI